MNSQRFYLTTPIYYASDVPHIGHAYTTIVGDAIARFERLRAEDPSQVFYLTGTDEHGEKIERAAAAKGLTPQLFVDTIAEQYKDLWKTLHIQYDDFIRTTEDRHKKVVQELWQKLVKSGDIYKGNYEGLYCVACESFYLEKDLLPGLICKDHKTKVELIKEESYFFKLSSYQQKLEDLYAQHENFITPSERFNEVKNFVKSGLKDLAVSRTSFKWGVPVPGDEKHVIYVWIDALTNYYSALQEPKNRQAFWGTKDQPVAIHLMGKEITRFHAIYWPAFLMALDLPLPKMILAHGWWTVDGEKMSKTLGNVVNPAEIAQDLGADALRYFLLREVPLGQDGNFSYDALLKRYNSDLANDLGNLLNRTLSMTEQFCEGNALKNTWKDFSPEQKIALSNQFFQQNHSHENARILSEKNNNLGYLAMRSFWRLQTFLKWFPSIALEEIFLLVSNINRFLEDKAPFKIAKTNPNEAAGVLYEALEALRWVGIMLAPYMPERANDLLLQLGIGTDQTHLRAWPRSPDDFGLLPEGHKIAKGAPLFPRLDADKQAELLKKWRAGRDAAAAKASESKPVKPVVPQITFETWQQLDLRLATIVNAEKVPKKDRLLKLTLSLETELRTVVSGIAERYAPEELIGRQVAFLANLQPAKIGGILSEGMILAVGEGADLSLLFAENQMPPGAKIK